MRTIALAIMACLLGTAAASGPDTLWVRKLALHDTDVYGDGIASRGNAIAAVGYVNAGAWLVARLNQAGDTIWSRTHDTAVGVEQAVSTCLDAESNVLVAGSGMILIGARRPGAVRLPVRSKTRNLFSPIQGQNFALTAKYDSLGELKWLRTDTNFVTMGITADTAGNCYISGMHYAGETGEFWLAKLNPSGDTIWSKTFIFAPWTLGYRVALDASGNIAATAITGDTVFDCLTLKFTPDGDTIWARRFSLGTDDAGVGIAVDRDGNIIVAGRTAADTTTHALVLKYDASGTLLWQKVFAFSTDDELIGASCDSSGDIYVAGVTNGGADHAYDCLTMKLDTAGDPLWTTTYGGSGDNEAEDVVCDPDGDPIIAGCVTDTISSNSDLLVAKYAALTGVAKSHVAGPRPIAASSTITAAPDFVLSVPGSGHYDIRLCDLTGRTRQQVFSGTLSKGAHRLSVSAVPAGMYFVRVAAPNGGISCQRMVVVK